MTRGDSHGLCDLRVVLLDDVEAEENLPLLTGEGHEAGLSSQPDGLAENPVLGKNRPQQAVSTGVDLDKVRKVAGTDDRFRSANL